MVRTDKEINGEWINWEWKMNEWTRTKTKTTTTITMYNKLYYILAEKRWASKTYTAWQTVSNYSILERITTFRVKEKKQKKRSEKRKLIFGKILQINTQKKLNLKLTKKKCFTSAKL